MEKTSYSHRFHAGNVGDVWKHVVWTALLQQLSADSTPLNVMETHAGEGVYKLPATGEWQAGIGKLWPQPKAAKVPRALAKFFSALKKLPPKTYPGSPLLTLGMLRATDTVRFYEIDAEAFARLEKRVGGDARAASHHGDGMVALRTKIKSRARRVFFIDPPYTAKDDWTHIPTAVADLHDAYPGAVIALWYPIKSYTRPNAMLEFFGKRNVPALALELVTTPLKLQRNRLNGSGMLLVNAPRETVSQALAAAPCIGEACATLGGHWALRTHRVETT